MDLPTVKTLSKHKSMTAAFILAAATTVSAPALAAGEAMSDLDVSIAVDQSLLRNTAVRASLIDVDVAEGVVTLSGTVNNLLAEQQALKTATTVRGVRSVIDHLDVRVPERTDPAIREDVEDAFFTNPGTETFEIGVGVEDGIVQLTGSVDAWSERILAEKVAKGVRGVRGVENDLVVSLADARPDHEIRGDIIARFENDVWIDANDIIVEVDGATVMLKGRVDSLAEKDRAESLAYVYNVQNVDTSMLAVQWIQDDEQRGYVNRTDAEVKQALEDALLFDRRVDSQDVEVQMKNRTATLTGSVDSLFARRAAEQNAINTTGVWRVRNQLKVRPDDTYSDSVLTNYVLDAMARDPFLNQAQIDVVVNNGVARVWGEVDTPFERSHADWVAGQVKGVIEVVNMLDVSDSWSELDGPSDWELREDIASQMIWSPYVDRDQVNISVDNGVATLTGTVDDLSEFRAATINAEEAGAPVVINDLDIRYEDG